MHRWVWGLALIAGCSDMALDSKENGFTTTAPDSDSASSPTDTGDDAPDTDLFAVSVRFSLETGLWAPDPQLRVDLYSPEVELVCSQMIPVISVTEELPPDGEILLSWWVLELGEGVSEEPCSNWPARTWRLGLGPYDVGLDPGMAARGMLGYDVYSLYLQEEPLQPVYIVGIGGTADMLSGTPDLTVEAPPLADGAYEAYSLVALTLE